jgi:hypothetical protein
MNDSRISTRFTPEKVSQSSVKYYIPIYQRLFEWDEPRILQLLDDLYESFTNDKSKPYYVGMLTSNMGNDLIDGQQRFTVMMLLGIVMRNYYDEWNSFLLINGSDTRLHFKARTDDNSYVADLCRGGDGGGYENMFMKRGMNCIKKFIDEKVKNDERKSFAEYVFRNMSFFISTLPSKYSPKALNKYFETMNSTGKNLENHEILKVKILHRADGSIDKARLTRIWNAVSDMDQKLIRRKRKDERECDLLNRFNRAYDASRSEDVDDLFNGEYINVLKNTVGQDDKSFRKIVDISSSPDKPSQQRLSRNNGFHSIVSFSEFLLLVLWMKLDEDTQEEVKAVDFFDVNKLQNTFQQYWNNIEPNDFVLSLLRYRLLYDRFVVNISNEDSSYDLDINDNYRDDFRNSWHDDLLMYESMLYVNSSSKSYYLWLPDLLTYVDNNVADDVDVSCEDLFKYIKKKDEERHTLNSLNLDNNPDVIPEELSYTEVDRYWFWKLDFYIWRNRNSIFDDESVRQVADNYAFRRARSIEHIAPQTPDPQSTLVLSEEVTNCFGNLVMISSSQNSSLQNSTFNQKKAKVKSHINKELNGTIESLKMLMIYQNDCWHKDDILKHQSVCLDYLRQSFEDE